jgi:hypothetical protein
VNEDEVRGSKYLAKIEGIQVVLHGGEIGIYGAKFGNSGFTLFSDQTLQAPGVPRLVDLNVVSARDELTCDAAQKMSIAVVPIREDGVVEHHYAHASASVCGGCRRCLCDNIAR